MEIGIRIAGAAGQGLQTTADMLGQILVQNGLFVSTYVDAESRIRGGLNFSHLRISDQALEGVSERFDILMALTTGAVKRFSEKLDSPGVLLCFSSSCDSRAAPVDLDNLAKQAGNLKASGVVGLGAICSLLEIPQDRVHEILQKHFTQNAKLLEINLRAADLGIAAVQDWKNKPEFPGANIHSPANERVLMSGHQAISLGAIAGGVSFVAGYPMSPATSILADLAAWSKEADIVIEQAEDEIAAINMLAGASYAGARSMTSTSGGGFCLMTEGVSLLGMIETPAVIVVAQRPGPATGLPTRTAQGDLNLVLHAGHGFFPRLIFAPARIEDGFETTAKAFDLAERFQVPVFILTDQLLQDCQPSLSAFDTSLLPSSRHLMRASELRERASYMRFEQTSDGISPQAAPGASQHVVVVDSDEHDEQGHLTESPIIAQAMSQKRIRKAKTIKNFSWFLNPYLDGFEKDNPLVISWGSTYSTISEIREDFASQNRAFSHLHLRQMWPLDESYLESILRTPRQITIIENNTDGQLASLFKTVGLRPADNVITRHDGRPFTVQDLTVKIKEVLS